LRKLGQARAGDRTLRELVPEVVVITLAIFIVMLIKLD
jgi:hypothetical protein